MRPSFPYLRYLSFLFALLGAFNASPAAASIDWTKVYSGYSSPTEVTNANDGSGRLFIVEQFGTIRIIKNGVALSMPFIDLGSSGLNVIAASDERGLLGLAFHPQYATNHQFYVDYTR